MVAIDEHIRVLIVDDHEMVRDGIRMILDDTDDIEVVGEVGTVADAVGRLPLAGADVAIVDLRLPDGSGIEVCRAAAERSPHTKAMILTSYDDDEALSEAVLAGAAGYVLKHVRAPQLVDCVRRIAHGESLLDRTAAEQVRERIRRGEVGGEIADLTQQERRVLVLLADGLTNRQIAMRLYLSDKTVKNYVSSLLTKLNMSRRSEAAAFAARLDARRLALASSTSDRAIRY